MAKGGRRGGRASSVPAEAVDGGGTAVATAPAPAAPAPKATVQRTAGGPPDFKPYTGADSLPPFTVIEKGKDGKPPRITYGEPRFTCTRGERKTIKVLAYFSSPRGVMRKVWGVLKMTENRPRDRAIMAKLKAAGVPGAV